MQRFFYIVSVLLLLALSCGKRVIPRDKMELILADMLVQDQQIKLDHSLRKKADTSLVYEPVFEAYGYDTDDFLYSLEYYMSDASRMEKIMNEVGDRLERDVRDADRVIRLENWRKDLLRIYTLQVDTTRRPRPRLRASDTLRVRFEADSVYFFYPADTLVIPYRR